VALNVTLCPWVKEALHVVGQLIPTGMLVTVPLPVPTFVTVRGGVDRLRRGSPFRAKYTHAVGETPAIVVFHGVNGPPYQ